MMMASARVSSLATADKDSTLAPALFGSTTTVDFRVGTALPSATTPCGQHYSSCRLPRSTCKNIAVANSIAYSAPFTVDASGGFLSESRRSIGKALADHAGHLCKRLPVFVAFLHRYSDRGGDVNDGQNMAVGSNNLATTTNAKPMQRLSLSLSEKQGKPDRRLLQEGFDIQPAALIAKGLPNLGTQYQI